MNLTSSMGTYNHLKRYAKASLFTLILVKNSWLIFSQNRLAVLGLLLIALFGGMAMSHPILMAKVWQRGIYGPETGYDADVGPYASPSFKHLLGTDKFARDNLSRLLYATRAEFTLAVSAALATFVVSIFIGAVSAYYRGWVDSVFSHLTDTFLLLPGPILVTILGIWKGDELGAVGFGLSYGVLMGVSSAAIIMRASALTIMPKAYIEAARVAGGGPIHIIMKHLFPQMLPLAIAQMMISVTGVVITDGFISWYGVGTTWNRLNWGTMVLSAGTLREMFPPALALSLFAASFYMVARGLQDAADPYLRAEKRESK